MCHQLLKGKIIILGDSYNKLNKSNIQTKRYLISDKNYIKQRITQSLKNNSLPPQFQFVLKGNSFFENGNENCIEIEAEIV